MTTTNVTPTTKKKASSVRHTRAIQRDRTKRPPTAPPDEQIARRLTEIVHPATLAQLHYYHQLGLRERLLTLPIMVGLVLSMLWRQLNGVSELVRVVGQEVLLWVPPIPKVSQQALAARRAGLLKLMVRPGNIKLANYYVGGKNDEEADLCERLGCH